MNSDTSSKQGDNLLVQVVAALGRSLQLVYMYICLHGTSDVQW
jgi:hypothetical protein